MAKKSTIGSDLDNLISETSIAMNKEKSVVDIITFCEDQKYLNFSKQDPPMILWPMQKIVLKMFYRGTRGNEHLDLTDDEIYILEDIARNEDLDYIEEQGGFRQVIDKYKRRNIHNIMLLIMGRRSSKTLLVSIIAAYEAYKLLETPEGNPHKYYNLSPDKPIAIINVAVNEQQAYDPLFKEIMSRISRAPYFADKINNDACNQGLIHLLTDSDKRENARRKAAGVEMLIPGSVILKSGHSNSASLRGQAAICILFDEFAHFMSSAGKQSGDQVFSALTPSTKQFGLDGKVVLLSDPKGRDGMFWKLFMMAQKVEKDQYGVDVHHNEEILALQLPTWRMNPTKEFSKEELERTERPKSPLAYSTSWAARFVGEAGEKFFDPSKLESRIDFSWSEPKYGSLEFPYYLHLDPATTSHNYALALVHPISVPNRSNSQLPRKAIVVDMVKYWKPTKNGPVDISNVEDTIREICQKFRVIQVTFDCFQSAQTIQRLRMSGINAFETPFTPGYLTQIYGELKNMVDNGDIVLPPHQLLIGEMKNLMYKILSRGFKRMFDPTSEYPSDDCVDAIAGAAFQALRTEVKKTLPRGVLVRMNVGR